MIGQKIPISMSPAERPRKPVDGGHKGKMEGGVTGENGFSRPKGQSREEKGRRGSLNLQRRKRG